MTLDKQTNEFTCFYDIIICAQAKQARYKDYILIVCLLDDAILAAMYLEAHVLSFDM